MGVRVDDSRLALYFKGLNARMSDMSEVLRWAGEELGDANRRNFLSQGAASGRPWRSLDPEYGRWKAKRYGNTTILIASGRLFESLTDFSRAGPSIGRHSATFGTDVSYAKYHQRGTRHMPKRQVMYVPPGFERSLAERAGDEIVYGGLPASAARRAKLNR